jgi:hypothetical protein
MNNYFLILIKNFLIEKFYLEGILLKIIQNIIVSKSFFRDEYIYVN